MKGYSGFKNIVLRFKLRAHVYGATIILLRCGPMYVSLKYWRLGVGFVFWRDLGNIELFKQTRAFWIGARMLP